MDGYAQSDSQSQMPGVHNVEFSGFSFSHEFKSELSCEIAGSINYMTMLRTDTNFVCRIAVNMTDGSSRKITMTQSLSLTPSEPPQTRGSTTSPGDQTTDESSSARTTFRPPSRQVSAKRPASPCVLPTYSEATASPQAIRTHNNNIPSHIDPVVAGPIDDSAGFINEGTTTQRAQIVSDDSTTLTMSSSAAVFGSTKRLGSYSRRVFRDAEYRRDSTASVGAVNEPLELEEWTRKDYGVISSRRMRPLGDQALLESSQGHIQTSGSQNDKNRRALIAASILMRHPAVYRRRQRSCFVSHSDISPSEGNECTVQSRSTSNMATCASTMWEDHDTAKAYARDGLLASGTGDSLWSHFDSNRATLCSRNSQLERNTGPDSYCLTLPARRIRWEASGAEEEGAAINIEKGEPRDALDLK